MYTDKNLFGNFAKNVYEVLTQNNLINLLYYTECFNSVWENRKYFWNLPSGCRKFDS